MFTFLHVTSSISTFPSFSSSHLILFIATIILAIVPIGTTLCYSSLHALSDNERIGEFCIRTSLFTYHYQTVSMGYVPRWREGTSAFLLYNHYQKFIYHRSLSTALVS